MVVVKYREAGYCSDMIISEYKLDFVVARLIERLESTRRTYSAPMQAEMESSFQRISAEHLNAVIGEFREMAMADHPDAHAEFLRREVMNTFLPRYLPMAMAANNIEKKGFGLGPLATPIGRIVIGFLAILLCILLPKLKLLWLFYPALPFLLSAPFLPDILRLISSRKYQKGLQNIVQDMATIQERFGDYVPTELLKADHEDVQDLVPSEIKKERV